MNSLQEIQRGADAERILNDPLYLEAFETVRNSLVSSMARSPIGDETTHHRLVIALQVLEQVRKALQDVINTGKMQEIQVKDKKRFFG